MTAVRTVFIIDDDPGVRESACALVGSMGCKSTAFASVEDFLAGYVSGTRGIVVVDLRMPGMSGLDLQEEVAKRQWPLPIIILTAYARTPTTVRAMQAGAVTIIDKPYHDDDLWMAVRTALAREENDWARAQRQGELDARLGSLTEEERRVLELTIAGKANKVIADTLGMALRTVEKRRRAILDKLAVDSVPEAIRLVIESRQGQSSTFETN